MKRTIGIIIAVTVLFALVITSCSNDAAPASGGQTIIIDGTDRPISLSELEAGGSIEIRGVKADANLNLQDFSLEDGVYIEVVNGRSIGLDRDGADSEGLFQRQDGTFIPIPDSEGEAEFSASALGAEENTTVIVHRFKTMDEDYMIDPTEKKYTGYDRQLAEEYYYIDLSSPEFQNLDPTEIVIVASGDTGAHGVSVIQSGYMHQDINGIFNFEGEDGFAVNMFKVLDARFTESMRLNVLNPIHLGNDPVVLNKDLNVFKVDGKASQQEYKVVVTFTGNDAEEIIRRIADEGRFLYTSPRSTDGSRRRLMIPEYNLEGKTITYHIGTVDEDLMFTLDYDASLTGFRSGSASLSFVADTEGIVIHDMSSMDEINLIAERPGYTTWAYTVGRQVVYDVDVKLPGFGAMICESSGTGVGTGGVGYAPLARFGSKHNDVVSTGFILIRYTGKENNKLLITMTRNTGKAEMPCLDVEWDPQTEEYVCINDHCEACAAAGKKRHYNALQLFIDLDQVLEEEYWTEGSYGVYGRLGFTKDKRVLTSNVTLNNGTWGEARKQYGMSSLSWNGEDTDKQVEICVTKILLTQKKLVCAVAFGGSTEFTTGIEFLEKDD